MRTIPSLLALALALGGLGVLADGATDPRRGVKSYQQRSEELPPGTVTPRHGQVQHYEPTALTEEEREAARARARQKMGTWVESEPPPPASPFPWGPLFATLLAFAVAAPLAWSSYRRHIAEMPDPNALGVPRRRPPTRLSR